MQVEILEPAENDLEDGYHFYEQQLDGHGLYFLDSLYEDINNLQVYAGIHPLVYGHNRLLSKHFPFAIYYSINEATVLIKAVLDCRRNPEWIQKKIMTRR